MENLIKKLKENKYKTMFFIYSIILVIPSVIYLIQNKTVLNFNQWFTYFLHIPSNDIEPIIGTAIFGIVLIVLIYCYFKIVKNCNREFENIKNIILYVLVIAIIFGITLPFTSSDIFYYMGTGWINSNYDENPYYTTVYDVRMNNQEDEILQRTGVWEKQVVVYGPLWTYICKILSGLSFGNVTLALYIYKIAAIGVHILNTYLIYKITKKKKFALLYGINPYILFEMITNVHNDLYLILFVLVALYFFIRKKNIVLTIVFMALATCIKYVSVLLIPFLVLYYLKDKKLYKKILYCILYAMLFIGIMALIYLLYAKDIKMFLIMTIQQGKYRESILTIILYISNITGINFIIHAKWFLVLLFVLIFIDGLVYMFMYKKVNFKNTIKKYNRVVTAFLFFIITNLCPWYVSWLVPTMFWLRGKTIKTILYIQFAYELVILMNFALFSESYKIGLMYLPIMLVCYIIYKINNQKNLKQNKLTLESGGKM